MEIFEFEIPSHTTRREWAVYIITAMHNKVKEKVFFYVGKVGDNRLGCNPIISRIGNHFSHSNIHSQMRNKLKELTEYNDPSEYNYKIFYATFGEYNTDNHILDKNRINEIERQLNIKIQEKQGNKNFLLNPYRGIGVSQKMKEERNDLLNGEEKKVIEMLAEKISDFI
jgi:hypothetical protein